MIASENVASHGCEGGADGGIPVKITQPEMTNFEPFRAMWQRSEDYVAVSLRFSLIFKLLWSIYEYHYCISPSPALCTLYILHM